MSTQPRTILITGACGDIGRSLARAFARDRANLALCDLLPLEKARSQVDDVERLGAKVFYGTVNVTDAPAMGAFVREAVERFGGLDICLVNAGIVERGNIVDQSVDAWRRTLDVNLTGAFITAQAAARAMIAGGSGGHLVFTSSWVQDHPRAGIGAYCASKGGLKLLAQCLALELGPKGIRVNLVAPGWVDAGLTSHNLQVNPQLADEMRSQIPLGRFIPADELAGTIRLLCSDDAAYLTGTTLLVDGGSSLCYRKPPEK
jgi:NAD(P)-dependent dehydrogenase (short-subunit alcohol dehydrogenase family)